MLCVCMYLYEYVLGRIDNDRTNTKLLHILVEGAECAEDFAFRNT